MKSYAGPPGSADSAMRLAVAALVDMPAQCRFHEKRFLFLGIEPWGEPRCDSCKAPWRRERALEAIDRWMRDVAEYERAEAERLAAVPERTVREGDERLTAREMDEERAADEEAARAYREGRDD